VIKKSVLKLALVTVGILSFAQSSFARSPEYCQNVGRNGSQATYLLQGYFGNMSASYGTDYGNHNFANRQVNCNGQQATVVGLQIQPGNPGSTYVTVQSNYGGGYLSNCRIDVSQNWQTTSYYCN
jgi:hypothetical protein